MRQLIRIVQVLQPAVAVLVSLLLAACAEQPARETIVDDYQGVMPVNFSGNWERDWSRGDDANTKLRYMLTRMSPTIPDQRYRSPGPAVSSRDISSLLALARFAELITRPEVLTIAQNDYEIGIAREDDFAMLCQFYDGAAKATASAYGTEVCGWDGNQLVSNLILPDGLLVSHRFTISEDGQHLRVVTTVSSSTSRVPFSLDRFYMKFEKPASNFNCIETLSMKRVCSTGELVP